MPWSLETRSPLPNWESWWVRAPPRWVLSQQQCRWTARPNQLWCRQWSIRQKRKDVALQLQKVHSSHQWWAIVFKISQVRVTWGSHRRGFESGPSSSQTPFLIDNGTLIPITLLQHSYCTFVTILFGPFARLFINLTTRMRALFHKICIHYPTCRQGFWTVPLFTEWVGASSSKVILAKPSRHSATGTIASVTSGSRRFSHSASWKKLEKDSAVSIFARWLISWTETAISSFTHCPVWLPIANTLPKFFVHAVSSPEILTRALFSKFPFLLPKFLFSNFLLDAFSSPQFSICDYQILASSDESPFLFQDVTKLIFCYWWLFLMKLLKTCHQKIGLTWSRHESLKRN